MPPKKKTKAQPKKTVKSNDTGIYGSYKGQKRPLETTSNDDGGESAPIVPKKITRAGRASNEAYSQFNKSGSSIPM